MILIRSKIPIIFATLAIVLSALFPVLNYGIAGAGCAANASPKDAVNCGVQAAGGDTSNPEAKINGAIAAAINIFSFVVGFAAVIMIIVGGLRYILSNGDSQKVSSAKNAIIYAIVGIVIVALAQVIVRYVFSRAT